MSTLEPKVNLNPAGIPAGIRFAPVTAALMSTPGVTLAAVKVWAYVWDQTLGRPTWTLSYRQIANATGLSRRSAVRAVAWLVEHEWAGRESRASECGDPDASLILCTFPAGVVTAMSPPSATDDPGGSDSNVTGGSDTDGPYQESHLPGESAGKHASDNAPDENHHPLTADVARALACSPDEAHAAITRKLAERGDRKKGDDGGGLIRYILRTSPNELRDLIPTADDLAAAGLEAEQIAAKAAERQSMVDMYGPRPADFDGGLMWDRVRTAQAMHKRNDTPVTEQNYQDAVTELRNHQADPTPKRPVPAGPWDAYDPDATLPPPPSGDLYGNFTARESVPA